MIRTFKLCNNRYSNYNNSYSNTNKRTASNKAHKWVGCRKRVNQLTVAAVVRTAGAATVRTAVFRADAGTAVL